MKELNERYFPDEEKIDFYGFKTHMEKYMKMLLTDPTKAVPDDYLKKYGIDYRKALDLLLNSEDITGTGDSIMRREEKIVTGPDGKDRFSVKYYLPRKDYKKKMRSVFINTFERNIIEEEDGGSICTGATNAESSGQFLAPMNSKPVKKRKDIYTPKTMTITESQAEAIMEATAGDLGQGYDVPFKPKSKKDPTLDHKNIMAKSAPEDANFNI